MRFRRHGPHGSLFSVLAGIENVRTRQDLLSPTVRLVLSQVHGGPGDPTFGSICGRAAISPAYLRKVFYEETGYTPREYLRRLRVYRAVQLMAVSPERALADVAYEVGYAHPGTLSRLFATETGILPSRVRRAFRLIAVQPPPDGGPIWEVALHVEKMLRIMDDEITDEA